MKIAGCETHAVRVTYEGSVSGLHVVLRLRTDAGIDGVSYVSRVSPQTIKPVVLLIGGNVGQLSGAAPLNAEALYARLFRSVNPLLGAPAGLEARAASAVEAALWDIRGKALGQPVFRLMGGFRDRGPVSAHRGPPPTTPAYARSRTRWPRWSAPARSTRACRSSGRCWSSAAPMSPWSTSTSGSRAS